MTNLFSAMDDEDVTTPWIWLLRTAGVICSLSCGLVVFRVVAERIGWHCLLVALFFGIGGRVAMRAKTAGATRKALRLQAIGLALALLLVPMGPAGWAGDTPSLLERILAIIWHTKS